MIFFIYNPPGGSLKPWPDLCVGAIGDVSDWSYEKLFCGVGTFELIVPIEAKNADKLKLNRILMSSDGEFIIKQLQYGAENITVSGYDINGILLDRLTVAMSEDGKDKVSGSTETIVKHFVDVNCVSSDDEGRNFPGLTIEADSERGIENDAASPRLECVADVISNVLSAQRMGWRISAINKSGGSSSALFRFYVYEAVNRTWGQTKNNPVTFSYGLGNANLIKTEKSMVDLKNTLYCELDDGTVQTYSPDDDNDGFNRTEEYTDLGCELSELEVYAEHEIADRYKPVQNVTLEHVDPSGYATGGFALGDIVTVVDDRANLTLEALITSIKIKRSGNEFDLDVTIGETRTKLIDRVAKKAAGASTAYKGVSTAIKSEIASGGIGSGGIGSGSGTIQADRDRLIAPSGGALVYKDYGTNDLLEFLDSQGTIDKQITCGGDGQSGPFLRFTQFKNDGGSINFSISPYGNDVLIGMDSGEGASISPARFSISTQGGNLGIEYQGKDYSSYRSLVLGESSIECRLGNKDKDGLNNVKSYRVQLTPISEE